MTSEGFGEMFEGDSADMCAGKFTIMLMEDERTVKRAQTVSEDPIGVSGISVNFLPFLSEHDLDKIVTMRKMKHQECEIIQ